MISIHALLAESDRGERHAADHPHDFYPRSPCGERRRTSRRRLKPRDISIHALLAESDLDCKTKTGVTMQFLSTLSLRRATTIGD